MRVDDVIMTFCIYKKYLIEDAVKLITFVTEIFIKSFKDISFVNL